MTHPAAPAPFSSPDAAGGAHGVGAPQARPEGTPPPRAPWWRRPTPVFSLVLGVVALVFSVMQLVGGISTLLGPGVVSSDQVAGEIQSRLTSGLATCPDDLPARVGASIGCTVLDGADTVTVRATVTAVDGEDVNYRIETVG
ncbi:DUF4333 domain-containing protein [Actinomycetospora atypica]|uniref:DUF4333 domain-containing protein n=1 Tax=Actinomycetospora atypica TaxID=1290095 RepID=A0ABV9YU55_9PSEU